MQELYDRARVADDLGQCRQRGLDWLDRRTSNQAPVRAAELQRLAEEHVAVRRLVAAGRIAQIKILLKDGIDELLRQGHATDAILVRDLFFGESMHDSIKSPSELLKSAQKRTGDTESRFRERRSNVMRSFAEFLIVFVSSAADEPDAAVRSDSHKHAQGAVTGYVGGSDHFIQLLADAVRVTIVGVTNENLAPMLQEALRRKRLGSQPDAFWGSLRIVFLKESLLNAVNDEREQFHNPDEALRQRSQEAIWARKAVGVFLKRTGSTKGELYESSYWPALTGALLEFGDGKRIVHLLLKRPQRPTDDHLYVDLEDLEDHYFSALFEDIVHHSEIIRMIVPSGYPANGSFQCTGIRLQSNVLKDGSNANGWLPMVLVIMSRRRGEHVEAMLQLRTGDNSARELNRISHLGGHILQDDRERPGGRPLVPAPRSFGLAHEIPQCAAKRLVQEVTGYEPETALQPEATGSYLYQDKEHLFFFIFALSLPEGTQFPRRAEMHSFPLPELLAIRENQVLRSAGQLCQLTGISDRTWAAAAEIMALNLALHDQVELGERIRDLAGRPAAEFAGMAATISQLVAERTSPSWASAGREVQLMGLAGWQYREFFHVLLPLYDKIGISGADDLLETINADRRKSADLARLAELYQDEHLMASIPVEL